MALNIFQLNSATGLQEQVSAGMWDFPVSMNVVPGGSAKTAKLYLQNNNGGKWYTGIQLTPTSINGDPIVSTNVVVKMLSGLNRPSEDEWLAAEANSASILQSPDIAGDQTRIPEIGVEALADTDFYPFWVRVSVAKSAPIGDAQFSLQLVSTEMNVVP